jgi:cysteinyl-tRNA synthetase
MNTLTRSKEVFKPLEKGKARVYSCGPTVYNFFHVGNARAFIAADLLVRVLRFNQYEVTFVRNYTDVDDKIIKKGEQEGVSSEKVAEKYIAEAEKDFQALELLDPDVKPRATEHVKEMIRMIEQLLEKGYAYVADSEVLYDISKKSDYGKLSKKNLEDLIAGMRVEADPRKKHPYDFTLWKPAKPGEPSWDSPWGKGRPGWHIECSAMSQKYLGQSFDIHHGGIDLVFPHHENEIAQSEAACGKDFARYWIHNEFLNIEGDKMSKSLGNIVILRDFLKSFGSELTKFFFLSVHYRTSLDLSEEGIAQAHRNLERYYKALEKLYSLAPDKGQSQGSYGADTDALLAPFEKEKKSFLRAINDDLNTPGAYGYLFQMIRSLNAKLKDESKLEAFELRALKDWFESLQKDLGSLFGVLDKDPSQRVQELRKIRIQSTDADSKKDLDENQIEALIQERKKARAAKDFSRADEIRDQLKANGVEIEDSLQGTTWHYI